MERPYFIDQGDEEVGKCRQGLDAMSCGGRPDGNIRASAQEVSVNPPGNFARRGRTHKTRKHGGRRENRGRPPENRGRPPENRGRRSTPESTSYISPGDSADQVGSRGREEIMLAFQEMRTFVKK